MHNNKLRKITNMTAFATDLKLEIHVGHRLTYECITPIAALPQMAKLNIRHFLISKSIFRKLDPTIAKMHHLINTTHA